MSAFKPWHLVLLVFFSGCSSKLLPFMMPTPTLEPTLTPTSTIEPTLTPTPTLKPTLTPTPTLEPTPTPLPLNLGLGGVIDLEMIDPSYFYLENQGVYRYHYVMFVRSQYQILNPEKGDTITGNSTDGWTIYSKFRNLAVFFGPGEKIGNNEIKFTLKAGEKDKNGAIVFTNTKTYVIPEGDLTTVHLISYYPGSVLFLYDPTRSGFIISSEDAKNFPAKVPELPRCAVSPGITITKDKQILLFSDYIKHPKWCCRVYDFITGKHNMQFAYRINGSIYIRGITEEGVCTCQTIKEYEESLT